MSSWIPAPDDMLILLLFRVFILLFRKSKEALSLLLLSMTRFRLSLFEEACIISALCVTQLLLSRERGSWAILQCYELRIGFAGSSVGCACAVSSVLYGGIHSASSTRSPAGF